MKHNNLLLLAGGVGAAKFIDGLVNIVDQQLLKIIVNTGDDIDLFGLKICPDLDIITYTLANIVDREKGWGYVNESFKCLNVLKKFYDTGWFNAGDQDLATHIYRTDLYHRGHTKSEITNLICHKLGVKAEIIPMCNEPVETFITTRIGRIHFEEFFIKHKSELKILGIEFEGIKRAIAVEGVLDSIEEASKIIICPSNPIVSIGTILQVKGIKKALTKVKNKVFAISPIIQGTAVKGPADKMMEHIGLEVSSFGVAEYYKEFLGNFIIDIKDKNLKPKIEKLGINIYCFDTLMTSLKKKKELAEFLLEL